MSPKEITDVFENTLSSRDFGFTLLLLQFCYMAAGEVIPGNLAKVARNVSLINLYNLAFILFTTTILVNLLVALMGSTYLRHTQLGRQMWWLEFADLVLKYEQRLTERQRESFRTGESVGDASDHGPCEHYMVAVAKAGSEMMESAAEELDEQDALQQNVHSMSEEIRALRKQVETLTDLLRDQGQSTAAEAGKGSHFVHSDWSALQETLEASEDEHKAAAKSSISRLHYSSKTSCEGIEASLVPAQVKVAFNEANGDGESTPKPEGQVSPPSLPF